MYGRAANLRTVMTGPMSDSGSMIALTREPSGSRASTRGLDLVDPPAERRDDPVDDPQHVLVVEEDAVDPQDLAAALDVDVLRPVDHDLGHGLVVEERLDRPEAPDLVEQLLDEPHPLVAGHGEALLRDHPVGDALDPAADLVGRRIEDRVERAHDLGQHRDPQVAQELLARGDAPAPSASAAAAGIGRPAAPPPRWACWPRSTAA